MELCKFIRDNFQRVLYYPACGEDWEPLCQLSHYCDVFVYCDTLHPTRKIIDGKKIGSSRDAAWLEAQFRNVHKRTSAGDRLQFQEVMELESYKSPDHLELKPFGNWAKLATFTLQENGVKRTIKLIYIKGHGEILYRTLFYNKSIAPRIICIRRDRKREFRQRNSILAQLVISGVCKPEFIITHYPLPDDCDWGWNQVVQRHFDGWDNKTSQLKPNKFTNNDQVMRDELLGFGRVSLLRRPR